MGRKLRVDFSNETVSDDDSRDRDGAVRLFPSFRLSIFLSLSPLLHRQPTH